MLAKEGRAKYYRKVLHGHGVLSRILIDPGMDEGQEYFQRLAEELTYAGDLGNTLTWNN